jgi:hypothetical protein
LYIAWRSVNIALRESVIKDKLSEIATRSLFSWIYFAEEGTRKEEIELWKHDWLSFLLNSPPISNSSSSSKASQSSKSTFINIWRQSLLNSDLDKDNSFRQLE